ncbi:MAG: sugar phosphate isomerase/epimerase [Oscillospiraceae bacterium]|nr:sugar phosphate isomerase/epimerase [Oscillospiraceae bacterium]
MYKSLNAGLIGAKLDGFEQLLAMARKYGYGAVSYSPAALDAEGIDAYQALDLMGQYGAIISDFGLPVQIRSDDDFNKSFGQLEKTARAAAGLGIRRTCTWMLSSSNDYEYAENFKRHTKKFRLIAEVLREYGILFGVEFLGPKNILNAAKYPFIHTAQQMLELCDAVGTGNMGLLLDAHHCYCAGSPGAEFAKCIRDEKDIVLVHLNDDAKDVPPEELKDSPRFYPGEPGSGGNDLHGFMGALVDLGYTGPVAAEPFSEALKTLGGDADAIIKTIAESTSSVWPKVK